MAPAPPTSADGRDGGSDDDAAAVTTSHEVTNTSITTIPPTTRASPISHPRDVDHGPPAHLLATIVLIGAPTLLPLMVMISTNSSRSDRGRASGGPLRDRRISVRSSPMPTVTLAKVARRGIDRPTVSFECASNATPPRPGPASLLSPSLQPQPGCSAPRGGRVGIRHRAARTAAVGDEYASVWAVRRGTGTPDAIALVSQETTVTENRREAARLDATPVGALALRRAHTDAMVDNAAHDHEQVEQGTLAGGRSANCVSPPPSRGAGCANGPTSPQVSATVQPPGTTPPQP